MRLTRKDTIRSNLNSLVRSVVAIIAEWNNCSVLTFATVVVVTLSNFEIATFAPLTAVGVSHFPILHFIAVLVCCCSPADDQS